MPVSYVVLYLYVRQDWLAQKNLPLPTDFNSFLTAAQGHHRRQPLGLRPAAEAPAATTSGPPSCSAAEPEW